MGFRVRWRRAIPPFIFNNQKTTNSLSAQFFLQKTQQQDKNVQKFTISYHLEIISPHT